MTRHNACPNPACGANVTGWSGGGGAPVRVTGVTGPPVSSAARYTTAGFVRLPTGVAAPGLAYTLSVYIKNNTGAFHFGKPMFFSCTRSAGGDDFQAGTDTPPMDIGATVRAVITRTTPALTTGVYLIIDSMPGDVGAGLDLTAVLYEEGAAVDTYFDGNTEGAAWDGAVHNSASTFTGELPPVFHSHPAVRARADLTAPRGIWTPDRVTARLE